MAEQAGVRDTKQTDVFSPCGKVVGREEFSDTSPSSHGDTKDSSFDPSDNKWETPKPKGREDLLNLTIAVSESAGRPGVIRDDSPMSDDEASILGVWDGPKNHEHTQMKDMPVIKDEAEAAVKDDEEEDCKPAAKRIVKVELPSALATIESTGDAQTRPITIKTEGTAADEDLTLVDATNTVPVVKKAPNKRILFSKHSSPSAAAPSPKLKGAVVVARVKVASKVDKATISNKAVKFVFKDQENNKVPSPVGSVDDEDGVVVPIVDVKSPALELDEATHEVASAATDMSTLAISSTNITDESTEIEARRSEDDEDGVVAPVNKVEPTAPTLELDGASRGADAEATSTTTMLINEVVQGELVHTSIEWEEKEVEEVALSNKPMPPALEIDGAILDAATGATDMSTLAISSTTITDETVEIEARRSEDDEDGAVAPVNVLEPTAPTLEPDGASLGAAAVATSAVATTPALLTTGSEIMQEEELVHAPNELEPLEVATLGIDTSEVTGKARGSKLDATWEHMMQASLATFGEAKGIIRHMYVENCFRIKQIEGLVKNVESIHDAVIAETVMPSMNKVQSILASPDPASFDEFAAWCKAGKDMENLGVALQHAIDKLISKETEIEFDRRQAANEAQRAFEQAKGAFAKKKEDIKREYDHAKDAVVAGVFENLKAHVGAV